LIHAKNRSTTPPASDDGEADLVVDLAHYLDADWAGIGNAGFGVVAIGMAQSYEQPARACAYPRMPPLSVVLTLRLSITAAGGLALLPVCSRSRISRGWLILSRRRRASAEGG
jgi:hypothetical protein